MVNMNITDTINCILNEKIHWNIEWIIAHKLDENLLEKSDIPKLHNDEIFVEHPEYPEYFVSQYGRIVSLKWGKVTLIKRNVVGPKENQYLGCTLSENGIKISITVHRAVADVFCPNFWKRKKKLNLQAHHIDGDHFNNDYRNLILLPKKLHDEIHKIKKIVLFKDGQIIPYLNVLDLVYDTGLTLEDIILARYDGRRKKQKATGGYTVYNVKGWLIGYKFRPQRKKRKKKAAKKQS